MLCNLTLVQCGHVLPIYPHQNYRGYIYSFLQYVMYLVYEPEAAWQLKGACIQKIENTDPLQSSE